MTRDDIYYKCWNFINKNPTLLMELPTGYGKSKLAIDLINNLTSKYNEPTSMLLLVAKNVHKQTWKEEFLKWGGCKVDNIVIECYESMKKHSGEHFSFILMDEVHHVKSELRMDLLSTLDYDYLLGLSATIPRDLKKVFKTEYHAWIVSQDIQQAIEEEVLPEPEIVLFPLTLDNTIEGETWEINARAKGPIVRDSITKIWKYKKSKTHAILSCTQRQKLLEYNKLIEWEKNRFMRTNNPAMKNSWLFHAGKRLEFLAYCKNHIVADILKRLKRYRTITFCKTIEQSEILGKNCIHSQNKKAESIYEKFNQKKINHITAVNILNENANLVDCKYAIFANIVASDIMQTQRIGRSMRHKHPVIIVPYYKDTREEEIVKKMFENYDKKLITVIHSIKEI